MRCPYCNSEMGEFPVEVMRASFMGTRSLAIFNEILNAGHEGISISELVKRVYPADKKTDVYNTLKVTIIRMKDKLRRHGWTINSGMTLGNATERVYRFKKEEPLR